MPNGRNSGRLYPRIPGDYEILVWFEDGKSLWLYWKLEGTAIGPYNSRIKSLDAAKTFAANHKMLLIIKPEIRKNYAS